MYCVISGALELNVEIDLKIIQIEQDYKLGQQENEGEGVRWKHLQEELYLPSWY